MSRVADANTPEKGPMNTSSAPEAPAPEEASPNPLKAAASAAQFQLLSDVEVEITLEIGRKRLRIADILKLSPGQTVELDKVAGEMLDIFVNGQLLGRGEAVVVGDHYGVRITELASKATRGSR